MTDQDRKVGLSMTRPGPAAEWNPWIMVLAGIVILACILSASVVLGGPVQTGTACAYPCTPGPREIPVFVDPSEKIASLKDPSFTRRLYEEALTYEPLLGTPGTQVHMGFWSEPGNHGSMLRVLDAINEGPAARFDPPHRAIWNEGVNAYYQYPLYAMILDEHWYERGSGVNGTALIFGREYQDPYPVTFAQADEVWGEYSSRYTEMAGLIARATGNPVKAWCFIQGARANRIFYTYEFPVLRRLEGEGVVEVHIATNVASDWTQPADWLNGTSNALLLAMGDIMV